MRRMRAAALRTLARNDEADREQAALAPGAWPVEQYAAGLLEWHRSTARDPVAMRRALGHLDRAIFLAPRAELLFHVVRAMVLNRLYRNDPDLDDRARDSASALTSLFPTEAFALLWAAQMTQKFDVARAGELARRATEIDPDLTDAYVLWSFAELALDHDARAEAAYRAGLAAAERFAPEQVVTIHSHWGEIQLAYGHVEAAIPPN